MFRIIKLYVLSIIVILNASNVEQEIGINIGLNSTLNEDSNKFKNPTVGISYQNNKYVVSPRVDLDYTKVKSKGANSFVKASINGVYEYENSTALVPYALAGVGYEYVGGATNNVLESHPFVQGGVGTRIDLDAGYKARVEAKMLQIIGSANDENNEVILTAGFSIPLGYTEVLKKRPRPIVQRPVVQPRPIIQRPVVQPRPIIQRPVVQPRPITPRIVYSNNNECSIKISAPDLDRDGIADRVDQCPATPCNFTVDNYGCPVKTTLKINFASNSAVINQSSFYKLNNFAKFLVQNRGSHVRIVGHTDSAGSAKHNLSLSDRRARSVVQSLISRGVSPARLQAEGKGESIPIASNQTNSGKATNRRIEAELFYPKGRR